MSRAYEKKASVSEVEGSGLVARYSSTLSGGELGLEATCFEKGIAWLRYLVTLIRIDVFFFASELPRPVRLALQLAPPRPSELEIHSLVIGPL